MGLLADFHLSLWFGLWLGQFDIWIWLVNLQPSFTPVPTSDRSSSRISLHPSFYQLWLARSSFLRKSISTAWWNHYVSFLPHIFLLFVFIYFFYQHAADHTIHPRFCSSLLKIRSGTNLGRARCRWSSARTCPRRKRLRSAAPGWCRSWSVSGCPAHTARCTPTTPSTATSRRSLEKVPAKLEKKREAKENSWVSAKQHTLFFSYRTLAHSKALIRVGAINDPAGSTAARGNNA